jgi:XisH protein
VKHALSKPGWTITDDPLFIRIGTVEMYIDLGAEKILMAEKVAKFIRDLCGLTQQK